MMSMGNRHRKGVGGIRACYLCAREQARNHGVDLFLGSIANANHRLLHQPRGIFANLNPASGCAQQKDASGLAKFQGRLRIIIDEHLLYCGAVRLMLDNQIGKGQVKHQQAAGEGHLAVSFDLTVGDMRKAVALCYNNAPAGGAKARVKA